MIEEKEPLMWSVIVHDEANIESSIMLVIDQLIQQYKYVSRPWNEPVRSKNECIKNELERIFQHALAKTQSGAYLDWESDS